MADARCVDMNWGRKTTETVEVENTFHGETKGKERERDGESVALSQHKRKTSLDHGLGSEKY